ncbi:DUF4330 family protein [Halobellus rarus]|uniref:DUF4330 family protein n=1 Tax=Halobellus rarus TaxID=1126237 RepID=A0ABD6CI69_9EURY|nr:DUF4330 family protein [Halobellus rarus]
MQPEPDPAEPDRTTRNVTLDLGTQPEYILAQMNEGDTYAASQETNLTITDLYVTPRDGDPRVFVRVQLSGPETAETLSYQDAPPRLGRNLDIVTEQYQVSGTIRAVGGTTTLQTSQTEVVVERSIPTADVEALAVGDELRVAGRTVGTVESVTAYGTDNPDQTRVLVGLSLSTLELAGERPQFGGQALHTGAILPIRTTTSQFQGQVSAVGRTEPPGTPTTTVTLQLRDVPPDLASSIRPGMTETPTDETVARITAVERSASTVVLTSQDGQIYEREHPVNQELLLTAELRVRDTATGTTFKGHTLQQGSTVVLDLGSTTIEATVVGRS